MIAQIVVCGGGHVAVSVVRLAKLLGLPVLAMEDRTEYAQDRRDAGADTVFCLPFAQALEQVPGGIAAQHRSMTYPSGGDRFHYDLELRFVNGGEQQP